MVRRSWTSSRPIHPRIFRGSDREAEAKFGVGLVGRSLRWMSGVSKR